MNREELSNYIEEHPQIDWTEDHEAIYLKHDVYDKDGSFLRIESRALPNLTKVKLDSLIVGGRNVDHITRITGYFSRVSAWNKGKAGELKDRAKGKL